jgi:hypothetical protein
MSGISSKQDVPISVVKLMCTYLMKVDIVVKGIK